MRATLIGVPLDLGAHNLGVDIGPEALRHHGIISKLEQAGLKLTDVGNLHCSMREGLKVGRNRLRYLDEILRVSEESAGLAAKAVAKGEKVIGLGGDHSVSLGLISGVSGAVQGDLGLIYLDAHGDMNTSKTTLTGNIHGMHLAALIGLGDAELETVYSSSIKIAKQNLVHIGGNDFDKAELDLVRREGLECFSIFDLLSGGLAPLMKMVDNLAERVGQIYVSVDLDAIDMVYAPGAGMPNKAGLTYREVAAIAEYIGKKCQVVGVDIVEYNPLQDVERKTADLSIELIAKFFGLDYSWYTGYMDRNKLET